MPTPYIKNSGFSAIRKVSTRIIIYHSLIVFRFVVRYFSYTKRYPQAEKQPHILAHLVFANG